MPTRCLLSFAAGHGEGQVAAAAAILLRRLLIIMGAPSSREISGLFSSHSHNTRPSPLSGLQLDSHKALALPSNHLSTPTLLTAVLHPYLARGQDPPHAFAVVVSKAIRSTRTTSSCRPRHRSRPSPSHTHPTLPACPASCALCPERTKFSDPRSVPSGPFLANWTKASLQPSPRCNLLPQIITHASPLFCCCTP